MLGFQKGLFLKKIGNDNFKFLYSLEYCNYNILLCIEKKCFKKSNNYWMMYKLVLFNPWLIYDQLSILQFIMKKYKIMYKLMQLISKHLYKKTTWIPLCKYMFIGLIWWKKNHMKISKSWNFETKGCKGNDFFIKSFGFF